MGQLNYLLHYLTNKVQKDSNFVFLRKWFIALVFIQLLQGSPSPEIKLLKSIDSHSKVQLLLSFNFSMQIITWLDNWNTQTDRLTFFYPQTSCRQLQGIQPLSWVTLVDVDKLWLDHACCNYKHRQLVCLTTKSSFCPKYL